MGVDLFDMLTVLGSVVLAMLVCAMVIYVFNCCDEGENRWK